MKTAAIPLVVFFSIFYAVGFFILGCGIKSLSQAMAAKNWTTTPGTLTDVRLVTDSDSDGTTYRVAVRYSYDVNGAPHEGKNISFGYSGSSDFSEHSALYEKLKPAKVVEVRVNPAEPSQSTLTYGADKLHFIMLIFGATWLLFVIGLSSLFFFGQAESALLSRLVVLE